MRNMIEYQISAKLWFDVEENTEIEDYLEKLREIGEARVDHVRLVTEDKDGNIKPA